MSYDEGYRAGMQKMREVGQTRIEELECEIDVIGTQVENIIYMCESNHEREAIVNYAKHMLTDINNVLGGRDE